MGACQSQTSSHLTDQELLLQDQEDFSQSSNPENLKICHSQYDIPFKKLGNGLRSYLNIVYCLCYIPEKNLLVTFSNHYKHVEDLPTNAVRAHFVIYIYNTAKNFMLVAARKCNTVIYSMSYSKELGKLFLGGYCIEKMDLKSFKVEAKSEEFENKVSRILCISGSNVIVAASGSFAYVYDQNLACLCRTKIESGIIEMAVVSKGLLLCSYDIEQPKLALWDLKSLALRKCDQLFIPKTSCIAMTEERSKKVFTCLTNRPEKKENDLFYLAQFTINENTKELVIKRMAKDVLFTRLFWSEKSNYFIAQSEKGKILLLNIRRNKAEVVCALSDHKNFLGSSDNLNFVLMKDESTIVIFVKDRGLGVYKVNKFKGSEEKDVISALKLCFM